LIKKAWILGLLILFIAAPCISGDNASSASFYSQGTFYLDWYGVHYGDTGFMNQASARIKLELFNRRGSGWTFKLDARDRYRFEKKQTNQVILYDTCLSFEKPESLLYLSLGQMNLYDTAGIGQLLGGIVGIKPIPDLLIGGYAGLESNIYVHRMDIKYNKFGFFTHYKGDLGKRFSLSYNHTMYSGQLESQYIYFSGMYPFHKYFVLFGNLEYQLGQAVNSKDRLSRLFLNMRFDPADWIDLGAFYSSGKGLDFHRFVLERSQDPVFNDLQVERYYYSNQYGIRLSIKPTQGTRFYLSRQEREQVDDQIQNHSWTVGSSLSNIFKTGISAYANFRHNWGEISESDSYYVSISKDFGKISWNASFSNMYNGIRFDYKSGIPQIIHIDDCRTLSTFFFVSLSRSLAVSLEYEYFMQEDANQHLFFVRVIYRKY
jgi:hypothetical protein